LETINPAVRESVVQTMDNLKETNKIYETEIEKAIGVVYNQDKGSISIPQLKTSPSPESILFELLKNYGFGKEVIREIHSAMNSQTGKMFYAQDYYIVKNRDEFLLSATEINEVEEYLIQENETFVECPMQLEIRIEMNDTASAITKNANIACLDYDKLHFPLILRKWKTGDKFMPVGMKNYQKLSNFFNNRKFSKIEKEKTWILTSGNEIVWVVNHRIDERFKTNINTKKRYILKLL
jgi:tRNA(Ile)-lysidine synthase